MDYEKQIEEYNNLCREQSDKKIESRIRNLFKYLGGEEKVNKMTKIIYGKNTTK